MYTVKLWENSGFNSIDRPDKRELLGPPRYTKQAVSLLQNRDITTITLRGTWKEFRDIDYVSIQDTDEEWYYTVVTKQMTSPDICTFALKTDYCLSVGLFENNVINNIQGITERYCVKDDTYGKYTENDTMLQPKLPLEIADYKIVSNPYIVNTGDSDLGDSQPITFIESTVDLLALAGEHNAITYSDSQGREVSVPVVQPINGKTNIEIDKNRFNGVLPSQDSSFKLPFIDGVKFYDASFAKVQEALSICRSLGIESSIIKQYAVPRFFIYRIKYKPIDTSEGKSPYEFIGPYYFIKPDKTKGYTPSYHKEGDVVNPENPNTDGEIETMVGSMWFLNEGDNFIYDKDVKNKKVMYARSFNDYVLMSAAGNTVKFCPDEIIPEGEITNETKPQIWNVSDIRPDAYPMYRFQYYLKQGPVEEAVYCKPSQLIENCVIGCPWPETPLIWTGQSNSQLVQQNFETDQGLANFNYDKKLLKNVLGLGTGFISAGASGYENQTVHPGYIFNNMVDMKLNQIENDVLREKDLYNYGYNREVVAPQIVFPFNTNFLRDITANGCISFRYRPAKSDREYFDRILTMYGYRATDYIQPWMFNCRQNFNFIKADNITILGDLPQSIKTGIVNELSAGIRFWHTTPNQEYYTNNPIKEEI